MQCYCHLWLNWLYHIFKLILGTSRLSGEIKVTGHKMDVLFFLYSFTLKHSSSFYEEFSYTLSQIYLGLHVNCPLISSGHNPNIIFSTHLRTTLKWQLNKIPSSGSRDFHADGRTDRHDEANIRISKFCEGP